jgi:hypothetical protein
MTAEPASAPLPAREWDLRRLVYGDWTWFVRDGLDVLRLAFIAGAIAFAVLSGRPGRRLRAPARRTRDRRSPPRSIWR